MPAGIAANGTLARTARKTRLGRIACLAVALLLTPGAQRLFSKPERPPKDTRIALIRGLTSEIGVTKITLPRGKRGIYLDAGGNLDEGEANKELRENGPAIRPGMPVVITKLTFKSDRIVFEINGGGKTGKKWYQRIEVGVGTQTAPIAPQPPLLTYGSWISLRLPDNPEKLTVQQVKDMLAGVLDFSRHSPTVLYSPVVSPEIKEAIKNHQVIVGMDRDAVLSSKGPPDRKVREVRDDVEQEDWIYGLPPHVLFVTFDGDQVVKVKQY